MLGFSIFDDDPIGYEGGPTITPHAPPQLILPPGYPYTDPPELDPIDGGPVKGPGGAVCNCLWGEPYITPDGGCGCHNYPLGTDPPQYDKKPPIKGGPTGIRRNPQTGGVRVLPANTTGSTTTATTAAAGDNKIFGLNPIVALGIAAAGIFLLSTMAGDDKPTKGGTTI